MKVLFQSFYLYFLGAAADTIKWVLEREIKRTLTRGGAISAKRLAVMSDLSYRLYARFKEIEKGIYFELFAGE